ncbi:MAG: signal peptide peptidase SppA [Bacillota bacterium]|nr:signal peptide peptidase SppA [Bacillota bacterium]
MDDPVDAGGPPPGAPPEPAGEEAPAGGGGGRGASLAAGLLVSVVVIALVLAILPVRQPAPAAQAPSGPFSGLAGLGTTPVGLTAGPPGVALLEITGPLATTGGVSLLGQPSTGADQVVQLLQQVAASPVAKALVIRLDTPGGSAVAASEIGEALQAVRKAGKPVVVSMGDVAASGGYWIAANADTIVANPATLTGSIGVILSYTTTYGLYQKLGLGDVTIKSGAYKDIGSPSRPVTPAERQILQGIVDDTYRQFVRMVATGRHLPESKVLELADGRVFTGGQALRLGLVDRLGNLKDALDLAARKAGLPGKYRVIRVAPNPLENLAAAFGLGGQSSRAGRLAPLLRALLEAGGSSLPPAPAGASGAPADQGLLLLYTGGSGLEGSP